MVVGPVRRFNEKGWKKSVSMPYNKGITIKEFQASLLLLMQDGASEHTNIHTMLYLQ